jgi:GxxExxY protein
MVVRYDGIVVEEYSVDLLAERIVLVELKVAKALDEIHRAQCLNYLSHRLASLPATQLRQASA